MAFSSAVGDWLILAVWQLGSNQKIGLVFIYIFNSEEQDRGRYKM